MKRLLQVLRIGDNATVRTVLSVIFTLNKPLPAYWASERSNRVTRAISIFIRARWEKSSPHSKHYLADLNILCSKFSTSSRSRYRNASSPYSLSRPDCGNRPHITLLSCRACSSRSLVDLPAVPALPAPDAARTCPIEH